ncbi:MAG: lactate utilization protein [Thermoguttaceae bacterium]
MSSRDAILQRVHSELSKYPPVAAPPTPVVWPPTNPTPAAMAEQFANALTEVQGDVVRCPTMQDARRRLAELASQAGWTSIGAMDRPLVREAAGGLPASSLNWQMADWPPARMAQLSASLLDPETLLADTGACVIACPTAQDRLLCYLPPACVVVARTGQLVEHLPAAWASLAPRVADPAMQGEFVIVTGPSRTADIEKILILGVHGPKRLVVLLVEG